MTKKTPLLRRPADRTRLEQCRQDSNPRKALLAVEARPCSAAVHCALQGDNTRSLYGALLGAVFSLGARSSPLTLREIFLQ
ncbi:unnamed protein product [Nezara viridula]|uniref:Uncharacterized protein n=1 Tax=Nezara viridula TaxID=85310 RepID=A0A9P0MSP9_NEZVI|nr:unnamed protein product [Nezara viridula]